MTDETQSTLEERVLAFDMMELPGQAPMMHMGTSYLVHDLLNEVKRLRRVCEDALGDEAILKSNDVV